MARRWPAFLLTHGSFNPVHRHHLEMMVHARQRLEAEGYEVVRGIMAITPAARLEKKGADAITDFHRLAALQIGCDSTLETRGWLVPEPRGVNYGSGGQLIRGLSAELYAEEPNATIFKVIGADVAVRYRGELKGPTVVVCRGDTSTPTLRAAVHAARNRDLYVVEELSGEECSSTKVREALRLNDPGAVSMYCSEPVAEYLLSHRKDLYGGRQSWERDAGYNVTSLALVSTQESRSETVEVLTRQAPNPGEGVTGALLRAQWSKIEKPTNGVLGFYGHGEKAGYYRCFSNFFDQSQAPFNFVVPAEICACSFQDEDRVVQCDFSEKAIMLCKAAAMGDVRNYKAIKFAKNPAAAKRLGRQINNFDDAVWDRIVCSVAFEVVYQKFSKTDTIRDVLLETGDKLIAEATRNDKNWGVGIDVGDPRVHDPRRWQGSNILGWALMETRAAIRGHAKCNASGKLDKDRSGAVGKADVDWSHTADNVGGILSQDRAGTADSVDVDPDEDQSRKKKRWSKKKDC